MTEPPDALDEVLDELRALRQTVERGIASAQQASTDVENLRRDIVRVEAKSDQRARTFRLAWALVAVTMVVGAVIIGVVFHSENVQRACFQDWANETAERTQNLAQASDTRIRSLNDALDAIAEHQERAEQDRLIGLAAAAGDAYEDVTHDNPPVSPRVITCQGPTEPTP